MMLKNPINATFSIFFFKEMESHGSDSQFIISNNYNRRLHASLNLCWTSALRPLLKQDLLITNLTELSKHIVWCLKEARLKFKITWKILKQTSPHNPVSNRCFFCAFGRNISSFVDLK